jgi:hypothetical protein
MGAPLAALVLKIGSRKGRASVKLAHYRGGAWRPAPFAGARPAIPSQVTRYTAFQQAPPDAVGEAIHSELEDIMLPAGVHFDWHPLTEAGERISSQWAVIHFKGRCDTQDLRPEWGYPGPLGWTHVSDGEVLPFIDVNARACAFLSSAI